MNRSIPKPLAARANGEGWSGSIPPVCGAGAPACRLAGLLGSALALAVLGVAGQAAAQVCPTGAFAQDAELDTLIDTERVFQHIEGMAVGISYGGQVIYLGGYGVADRRGEVPVTASETLFRWASVSKTLTGVAAQLAVEDGALDLDVDIRAFYPDYQLPRAWVEGDGWLGEPGLGLAPLPEGSVVSTRMLLGHLAGAQHYSNGLARPTPALPQRSDPAVNTGFEWALPRWVDAPLIGVPGASYSYTTMGFNLAGAVIGAAVAGGGRPADQTFEALVLERIAAPAGATGLQADRIWEGVAHRADGFVVLSPTLTVPDSDTDVSWKLPGGGFMSTARDMACYCRALSDDTLLTERSREAMFSKQTTSSGGTVHYGMGFDIGSRNGRKRVSHNGEQEKASSRLALYPDDGLCVTVLTNTRSFTDEVQINLGRLTNAVEDVIRARIEAGAPLVAAP